MWSPGEQTTFQGAWDCSDKRAFVWFRRKAVVKEETKTIKSICRGNVNTACWVAAHVVKKNVSVPRGIAGWSLPQLCEPAGHLGPRAAGGGVGGGGLAPLPRGLRMVEPPLQLAPGRHGIPHSLLVSSASSPGWFREECAFPGGLVVQEKDINSREVSREAL